MRYVHKPTGVVCEAEGELPRATFEPVETLKKPAQPRKAAPKKTAAK